MEFSRRLDAFDNEVFASLNARRRELEAQGKTIVDLSVGTPDFEPPAHVVNALVEAASNPVNWKYSLHDTDELLEAVCAYYQRRFGVSITPDMVMMVSGTQEGMGHLALALLDPGDSILVPDPCYPIFAGAAHIAGATPVYYPLARENGFRPDVGAIDPAVADAATYMVVSLPANPVGSVSAEGLYEGIIDFALEHDLLIVHDNAYSDIVFDGPAGGSFLSFPGAVDVGVEFFSLSKSFNVTGARLSFLVGRPDVVAALRKLRGQIDFGTFMPLQKAAVAALQGPLEPVEEQRLAYQTRRDALADGLEAIGWDRPNAKGTMFMWAKLPERFEKDSMAFAEELMEKAGVIVTPGASFGPEGEGYVRFALVCPAEELAAAAASIGAAGFGA
ncbi:aminotransferase class I/II-fold pyridoxal phosphate-dependent enzyme [Atopobiaceae bacterium 24-176]